MEPPRPIVRPSRRSAPALAALLVVAVLCRVSAGGAAEGPPAEPAYCDPATFSRLEVPLAKEERKHVKRLHVFRLGRVTVAGLAVGHSAPAAVRALAGRFSRAGTGERYCTWYLNDGNPEASRTFNFHYVPNPILLDETRGPAVYLQALDSSFAADAESFLSCAEQHGFLALGCDGMRHRGPTVFGMLLAFSGCAPEHALRIANDFWDLNGVRPAVRLAIIRAAYDRGRAHPGESERLRALLAE
jgi:hypothetical protein